MAKQKGSKGNHSFFKESSDLHNSVGSFDGGSCLNGHKSKWVERDSCSYRWQGIKKAKENSGPYNSHGTSGCHLDGSGIRWLPAASLDAGRSGKILRVFEEAVKKNVLKRKVEAKNFTNGFLPYNNQVHHVLPNAVLKDGIEKAVKKKPELVKDICDGLLTEKYNINFKDNMLILPVNWVDACEIGLPTHCGSHPEYSAKVMSKVRKALQPYAQVADQDEEHDEPDFEDLKDELIEISQSTYSAVVAYGQSTIKARCASKKISVNQLPARVFSAAV